MYSVTGSPIFKAERYSDIRSLVSDAATKHAALDAFIFRRKPNLSEEHRSFAQFGDDVKFLGTYIANSDYVGSNLAVVGENSYEWLVCYAAVLGSSCVGVPLDRALPEGELVALLERSASKILFYHPKHHEMIMSIANKAESKEYNIAVEHYVCMTKEWITDSATFPDDDNRFVDLYDLIKKGKDLFEQGNTKYFDIEINPDDVKIILFTSGTTSMSKGVLLTHKNICSNVYSITSTLYTQPGERCFSILPLHHTFENTCDFYLLSKGVCICQSDGLRYIVKNFNEWHCDVCVSVPLLFENIYDKLQDGIAASGKQKLIDVMVPVTKFLRKCGLDLRRAVFSDILKKLGGNLRMVVIGGAGIDKKYIETFNNFGIDFFMGYGLTETSPVISVTSSECNVYGSVGRPMEGITVAINNESNKYGAIGEILTKSKCVMKGYYKNEEATKEAIDVDGWFHTGDMGFIDKKGCIHVTGRVKSMIVLTNGKKAFPEEIESMIADVKGVSEVFVWGDSNERGVVDICAKILIDRKAIGKEIASKGIPSDNEVSVYLSDKLREINHKMPSYKIVRNFVFSEEEMIKTTTLKIKRQKELERIEGILAQYSKSMKDLNATNIDAIHITSET